MIGLTLNPTSSIFCGKGSLSFGTNHPSSCSLYVAGVLHTFLYQPSPSTALLLWRDLHTSAALFD